MSNIKGSFLGSNIRKYIDELALANHPDNFDELFNYHQSYTWNENLERLVERTNNIKPVASKAILNNDELKRLKESPQRAVDFVESKNYLFLRDELRNRCENVRDAILVASRIDNVNIRGRIIEVLITSESCERTRILHELAKSEKELPLYRSANELGDFKMSFENASTYTDIKTKIMYLNSNPKAYNVDKFLKCMAEPNSVFLFFFVGIDENGNIKTALCSVYHDELLKGTILQHHWAGKESRGVAQFSGKMITRILEDDGFVNCIDIRQCAGFIDGLLAR